MPAASSGAGSPLSVAATKSAFSLFSPDRDVLGRWLSHPPPPPRREPARRAMKHGRRAQGYNDRPGVFARPAATVASGVNPLEQRPSLPAATADRRSARPSSTARMARARSPLKAAFSDQRSAFSLVSPAPATRQVRRRDPAGGWATRSAARRCPEPGPPAARAHATRGCRQGRSGPRNRCPEMPRALDRWMCKSTPNTWK